MMTDTKRKITSLLVKVIYIVFDIYKEFISRIS